MYKVIVSQKKEWTQNHWNESFLKRIPSRFMLTSTRNIAYCPPTCCAQTWENLIFVLVWNENANSFFATIGAAFGAFQFRQTRTKSDIKYQSNFYYINFMVCHLKPTFTFIIWKRRAFLRMFCLLVWDGAALRWVNNDRFYFCWGIPVAMVNILLVNVYMHSSMFLFTVIFPVFNQG